MSDKEKKYFWIKLQKNFFNSLEIKTVLKMQKGSEYVIFWQKLLLEVIDKIDNGFIRYKENIPYTPEVLSTITDTDIDTVKGALSVFVKLQMLDISEKGDLIIDEVIHEMIGKITEEGKRKKIYRDKIAETKLLGHCPTVSQNVPTVLELELELDKDIYYKCEYFAITNDFHKTLKDANPNKDIDLEYKKSVAWLKANPNKQKKDYKRFINNWMSQAKEKVSIKSVYQEI